MLCKTITALKMNSTLYKNQKIKFLVFIFLLLGIHQTANAHVAIVELENMSTNDTIFLYIKLGFQHIIPLGIDHILFVIGLCLLSTKIKTCSSPLEKSGRKR